MLSKRYAYDGMPVLSLNQLQKSMKNQVDQKVRDGVYQFEEIPCCICSGEDFEYLAEKDRYGLYMPVVICRRCGLIQTNPRMSQNAYGDFYNTEYRRLYVGTETATQDFFAREYRKGQNIFNYLEINGVLPGPPDELFAVEVGCGAGGILQYFKGKGCRVKGIDLGEEYVEFGRSEYGLNLSVGTIADIDLGRPFDIIIYSHVIEHILSPNEELEQVHKKLSNKGIVYVEVPGVRNLMRSYEMDFLRLLQNAHTYHFTLTTLTNLMRRNGFRLVRGTEDIYSIFRKVEISTQKAEIVGDYNEVLAYLRKVEYLRRIVPFPPYKIVSLTKSFLIRALKLSGMYGVVRNLYYRLKILRKGL